MALASFYFKHFAYVPQRNKQSQNIFAGYRVLITITLCLTMPYSVALAGSLKSVPEAHVYVLGKQEQILWRGAVEIAATPDKRRKGLSGRASINPDEGMLFVYKEPHNLTFWMQDTHFPLLLLSLDCAYHVTGARSMAALDETVYRIGPGIAVLEIPQPVTWQTEAVRIEVEPRLPATDTACITQK